MKFLSNDTNSVFNYIDLLLVIVVFFLSSVLFILFYRSVNNVTIRNELEKEATITFKRNKAQRQFDDSLLWERLRNRSSVYDGDTIRTGSFSEAALHYDDGTELSLSDNTIIKIRKYINNTIDFMGGAVFLRSSKDEKQIIVRMQDDSEFVIDKDTNASLIENDGKVLIGVNNGSGTYRRKGVLHEIDRENELSLDTNSGEVEVIKREVFPVFPEPDAKFLTIDDESFFVEFRAEVSDTDLVRGYDIRVEVSDSIGFDGIITTEDALFENNLMVAGISLGEGVKFWRFVVIGDNDRVISSSIRRIAIYKDNSTVNLKPSMGENFGYRVKIPTVEFLWTDSKYASGYILEISDTEDMSNIVHRVKTDYPSINIDSLTEGKWFWRVLPDYSFVDNESDLGTGSVSSFSISVKNEISQPRLMMPIDESLFEIITVEKEGLGFSWLPVDEAVSYQWAIFNNDDTEMLSPVIEMDTQRTFLHLKPDEMVKLLTEESWIWSVSAVDSEGGKSKWSEVRKITGVDVAASLRLVYPVDDYIIGTSFITNFRFGWKSNIPARTEFQLSRSDDFSTVSYSEEVETETILGRNWNTGEWYWRLRTFNADGSVFADSDVRKFEIAAPIEETFLSEPEEGSTVIVYEGSSEVDLKWESLDNADYYDVKVIVGNDNVIFERAFYTMNQVTVDLLRYENQQITVSLRAGTMEKENSTPLYGLIAETNFNVRTLKPIDLKRPLTNTRIPGLINHRSGFDIEWHSEEELEMLSLYISTDISGNNVVYSVDNPSNVVNVKGLKPGQYYCDIVGLTTTGYEIGLKRPSRFIIDPIPLLDRPITVAPSNGEIIDFNYLSRNKAVIFEWSNINGASSYEFSLYELNSNKLIFRQSGLKENKYVFKNLTALSRGDFYWKVEAKSYDENGRLEQNGKVARSDFSLDIPEIKDSVNKDVKDLYGL